MDPQTQASFIPKKPLVASATVRHGGRVSVLWIAVLLIFIASVIAAGAAFFYKQHIEGSITSASESLALAEKSYDSSVIQDLIRLNNRIAQAKTILDGHLAPSFIFAFLGQNTLATVRFTSFEYGVNPNGDISLSLNGTARDFPSVALQSDTFGKNRYLKDVLFSNVNIDPQTGGVVFQVSATVDPTLLSYRAVIAQGAANIINANASAVEFTATSSEQTP